MKTASTPTFLSLSLVLVALGGCLTHHVDQAAAGHADGSSVTEAAIGSGGQTAVDAATADTGATDTASPTCTSATATCTDDHTAKLCGDAGWQEQACSGDTPLCLEGACVACAPGAVRCQDGGTIALCDQRHTWQVQACPATAPICDGGACVVCVPGTVTCADAQTIKICTANRQWQQQFACANPTPACVNGNCLECQPGSTRTCGECGGGTQTCSATGSWGACAGEPGPRRLWYRDADGDGYGSSSFSQISCAETLPGWALNASDCCDVDARVHPGAGFQTKGDALCSMGWDFDCSGTIEKQYPATYKVDTCDYYECAIDRIGWVNAVSPIPDCGGAGMLVSTCEPQAATCTVNCMCKFNQTSAVQGCR